MSEIEKAIGILQMGYRIQSDKCDFNEKHDIKNQEIINARDALNLAITALTEKAERGDGWISVKDRLPEIDMLCIVTDGEKVRTAKYTKITCDCCKNIINNFAVENMTGEHVTTITHWQPLPEPPEGKG